MVTCAYCGGPGPLTRQHVPAKWLQQLGPMRVLSERFPGKAVRGESTIRDVCARCNHGPLSLLDDYARKLLVPAATAPSGRYPVRLVIDRDRLLRWVLMGLYDDARVYVRNARYYSPLAPFILGSTSRLPAPMSLLATVVAPVAATPEERAVGGVDVLDGRGVYRIGSDPEELPPGAWTAFVSIGALILRVVLWSPLESRAETRRIVRALRCEGFQLIRAREHPTSLAPGRMDGRTWLRACTRYRPGMKAEA